MSNAVSNSPKKTEKGLASFRAHLESPAFAEQLAGVLPEHLTPKRMVRVAVTAMQKNPKIADCSQASIFSSLLQCSELGLEPDGRLAYLIPYGQECTLVIGYKGLAALALRSGQVSYIHADKVCDKDVFVYRLGQVVDHVIDFKRPRGLAYAYYAMVKMKDGETKYEVMSLDEVIAIRERSQGYQSAVKWNKSHPWMTDFDEMAKKTVFRRLSKWLELSPEYRAALDRDDEDFPVDGRVSRRLVTPAADLQMLPDFSYETPEVGAESEPAAEVQADPEKPKFDQPKLLAGYRMVIEKATSKAKIDKVVADINADSGLEDATRQQLLDELAANEKELPQ